MIRKKYIYIIIIGILLAYFVSSSLINSANTGIVKFTRDNLPTELKKKLKGTIFIIPSMKKKIRFLDEDIKKLKTSLSYQKSVISSFINKETYGKISLDKIIFSKNNKKYNLTSYILPFYDLENSYKNKKQGYLEIYDDQIITIFQSGKIVTLNKNLLKDKEFISKEIKNNLDNYLIDHNLKWTGIKDAKIYKDQIFLSYTKNNLDGCYSVAIVSAKINFEKLDFKDFFSFDDCVDVETIESFSKRKYFGGWQAGGRIEILNKNEMLLTVGDYKMFNLPQDDKSSFGKIISINMNTKISKFISKGHRNPQGLFYDKEKNILVSTEHGPQGGDEVNVIKINNDKIANYGWPVASYGTHYPSVNVNKLVKKIAPLHKSHSKYGFLEPIIEFTPSLGISQIIKNYYSKNDYNYYVSSLKDMSINEIEFNKNLNKAVKKDLIQFDERIRDLVYDEVFKTYYIFFENTPKIGVLKRVEK